MKHRVQIKSESDDTMFITLDGFDVAIVNHDDHGWAGMIAVEDAVRTMAAILDVEVEDFR